MKKVILENVRIIVVAIILSLGTSVVFAWTGPTATPPSSNISAPVNIGSTSQIKTGGLWLNSLGIDNGLTIGGNVGIGTTAPTQKLDVNGNVRLSSAGTAGITALTGTRWGYSASYPVVMVGPSSGTGNVSIGYDPSANTNNAFAGDGREVLFRNGVQFATPNAANTAFYLNNLVLKDGNVGIGTTAPTEKLEVNGNIKLSNGVGAYGAGRVQISSSGDLVGLTLNSTSRVWDLISITSLNPDYFAIRDSTAGVNRLQIDQDGNIAVTNRITGVAAPINSSDVATKGYVDALSTSPAGWTCTVRTATSAAGSAVATASCLTTEKVISGGCNFPGSMPEKRSEYPTNQGWACVSQYSPSGSPSSITAYANCCK